MRWKKNVDDLYKYKISTCNSFARFFVLFDFIISSIIIFGLDVLSLTFRPLLEAVRGFIYSASLEVSSRVVSDTVSKYRDN